MTKKAIVEKLRVAKIFNEYEITAEGHPFISLRGASPCLAKAYLLTVIGEPFSGSWYDHGSLSFTYGSRESKKEAMRKALAKVEEMFPGLEMVGSPFGTGLVPKADLERAYRKAGL